MSSKTIDIYAPTPSLAEGTPLRAFVDAVNRHDFDAIEELDERMSLSEPEHYFRNAIAVEALDDHVHLSFATFSSLDDDELAAFLTDLGVDYELVVVDSGPGGRAFLAAGERVEEWNELEWRWLPEPDEEAWD